MKYATLVGSRSVPESKKPLIRMVGFLLASRGIVGRSGKADGSDTLFLQGYHKYCVTSGLDGDFHNYLPWEGFNSDLRMGTDVYVHDKKEAEFIAKELLGDSHWNNLRQGGKALHTRNVYQVLGEELDKISDILVCYAQPTKTGVKGGTNTAYRLALQYDVPCYNLWNEEDVVDLFKWIRDIV